MNAEIGLERCLSFINCQLQPPRGETPANRNGQHRPVITLSRQSGSGAHLIAQNLLELLSANGGKDACPWAVFDRNLVEKVLEDHHLPSHMAKFMPEDKISEISDTMDELFGLHPPSWTLVHKMADTILHLAELGNVIFIGRAAAVITARLDYAFHVRLIGSIEKRVKYIQRSENLSARAALELVRQEDRARKRYLKKYFHQQIDDPLLYHLTINTDLVPYEEAARIIAEAVARKTTKRTMAIH
jgi:cytidylate kinase-like protein